MKAIDLNKNIVPLSRFRAELAETVRRVRDSKSPVVVTQHGESSVVVVDVEQYQAMLDELETVRDIVAAERELEAGLGVSSNEARAAVLDALK